MAINHNRRVTQYALISAFGGFVFGLDAANISGVVRYVTAQFGLSSMQMGSVVGVAGIGAIVALMITGSLCDKYGRKNILLGLACLYTLSSTISSLASSYEVLLVGRFIGGMAFCSLSISSMYIGEIAPADKRGKFVSINQLLITIGSLVAFIVNYLLVKSIGAIDVVTTETVWRFMLGFELIPNIIWIVLLVKVPKSPRWLISKGRITEAREVFKKIVPANEIEPLIMNVRQTVSGDNTNLLGQVKDLFSRRMRLVLFIAVAFAITQQVIGINAVLFYAPVVFEQIGMSVESSFMQTIYVGIVNVSFTIVAILFVEKLGRRKLTLAGLALIVIAHGSSWYGFHSATYQLDEQAVASLQQQKIPTEPLAALVGTHYSSDVEFKADLAELYSPNELPLVTGPIIESAININASYVLFGIFVFLGAFHFSIGPIMWVIFSEIFPNKIRSIAIPFAALITSLTSYFVQQFFPWQLEHFGAGNTFLSYGAVGLVSLIIMLKVLPETKSKSIEDIEAELVAN
ncbi:MFS transporter [Photobacterium sp. DNB22_13_2]